MRTGREELLFSLLQGLKKLLVERIATICTICIDHSGNTRRIYKRKPFTHFVWNLHHPTDIVKKGMLIHHKDEDTLNDDIENLDKITFYEHSKIHNTEERNRKKSILFTGIPRTLEVRTRISISNRGKKRSDLTRWYLSEINKGKKLSEEGKAKFTFKGRQHTEDAKAKIAGAMAGDRNHRFGKHFRHTEDTKNKIRETKLRNRLKKEVCGEYTNNS